MGSTLMLFHRRRERADGEHDFYWAKCPRCQRETPALRWALRMNPSQRVDTAFKVYNTREARKVKQATVVLEAGWGGQRRKQDIKEGGEAQ